MTHELVQLPHGTTDASVKATFLQMSCTRLSVCQGERESGSVEVGETWGPSLTAKCAFAFLTVGIQGPREVHVQLSTSNLQVCLSIGNFSRFIKQAAVVVSLQRQSEREGEASQARQNAAPNSAGRGDPKD